MPVLHIRINSANQNIIIAKELKAQKMTLLRTTIYKNDTAGKIYKGSLFFDIDFFNGFEYVSNLNDNFLISPISDEANSSLQTYQADQDFNSEDVRQAFNIKTYNFDATDKYEPALFDPTGATAGAVIYVDLFFQVSTLFDYSAT
jgi:hypothetical protein